MFVTNSATCATSANSTLARTSGPTGSVLSVSVGTTSMPQCTPMRNTAAIPTPEVSTLTDRNSKSPPLLVYASDKAHQINLHRHLQDHIGHSIAKQGDVKYNSIFELDVEARAHVQDADSLNSKYEI